MVLSFVSDLLDHSSSSRNTVVLQHAHMHGHLCDSEQIYGPQAHEREIIEIQDLHGILQLALTVLLSYLIFTSALRVGQFLFTFIST